MITLDKLRTPKVIEYCDVKKGTHIQFKPINLELIIEDIARENLYLSIVEKYKEFGREIKKNEYFKYNGIGIYNFGKGCGQRNHIRIEIPRGTSYVRY